MGFLQRSFALIQVFGRISRRVEQLDMRVEVMAKPFNIFSREGGRGIANACTCFLTEGDSNLSIFVLFLIKHKSANRLCVSRMFPFFSAHFCMLKFCVEWRVTEN